MSANNSQFRLNPSAANLHPPLHKMHPPGEILHPLCGKGVHLYRNHQFFSCLHILKDATPKKPRNSGVFWRSRGQATRFALMLQRPSGCDVFWGNAKDIACQGRRKTKYFLRGTREKSLVPFLRSRACLKIEEMTGF